MTDKFAAIDQELMIVDLATPADNGLKRGRTTGTCATAAVKAALILLEFDQQVESVSVTLPANPDSTESDSCLIVPIESVALLAPGIARAEVIKDAGDDPDCTDKAKLFAIIERRTDNQIRFLAGEGVGTVTGPGIRVPIGEPAINPVPRQMILQAVAEVAGEPQMTGTGTENGTGFDLTIGCEDGKRLAGKTFNPRLGIVGGISILGTTGIVEPMSLAAYKASIEVYIRVALAENSRAVAYLPGNLGRTFAREALGLLPRQIVHISNFIGFSLEATSSVLAESAAQLEELWLLGHPGKLAKLIAGDWDTHSKNSPIAVPVLVKVAGSLDWSIEQVEAIAACPSVEAVVELLAPHSEGRQLWQALEIKIAQRIKERGLPHVNRVCVRLFDMKGTILGKETP